MAAPTTKPARDVPLQSGLVPHPDDEANVRAGLEEAERGELLSLEESEAHVRSLLEDPHASTE